MRLRIGYGTVIALILAVVLAGAMLYRQRTQASRPPVVERQVLGAGGGIAPVPEFLLQHGDELRLTSLEIRRVRKLATSYRHDVAPVQVRLAAAAGRYRSYLDRAGKDGERAGRVAAAGAEMSRLSRVIAATRRSYWRQALAQLSPPHQTQARALAARAKIQDLQ